MEMKSVSKYNASKGDYETDHNGILINFNQIVSHIDAKEALYDEKIKQLTDDNKALVEICTTLIKQINCLNSEVGELKYTLEMQLNVRL